MKHVQTIVAAMIGLSAIVATPVSAQQPSAAAGTLVEKAPGKAAGAQVATVSAKVVALDKDKRLATLQGPLGNQFRVVAGKEVRNFDQIKVGDELVVTHVAALTLELKKGGDGIRERVETEGGGLRPRCHLPAYLPRENPMKFLKRYAYRDRFEWIYCGKSTLNLAEVAPKEPEVDLDFVWQHRAVVE